jgi:hypothetical protein
MSRQNDPNTTTSEQTARGQQQSTPQQGTPQQGSGQAGGQPRGDRRADTGLTDWLASSALRASLVLIGFVLFLFALGQAVGFGLLDLFVDAVTSQTGRWLVVAGFALLLIFLGQQGLKRSSYYD